MAKEITKNYIIWTLVLAVVFSLMLICGIVFVIAGPMTANWLMLAFGIIFILAGGLMSVLMWIAYSTSVKTYNRKNSEKAE